MKIDRLMGIVVYLLNHGRTSAQQLAEEFEVSPRTVMRDLDSLDQAGIPIQAFCGSRGGYQIMDSFVLEKQAATAHEYDWILAALKGMASGYENKSLEQTLEKFRSVGHTEAFPVSMDLSAAREDSKINEQLQLLEASVKKKCLVRFTYTNSRGERRDIQLDPVALQYKWYNWYLIGYYEKYHDYCMFKLVRMENLRATDIVSTAAHDLSSITIRDSSEKLVHIRLYGKAAVRSKCREYLNGQITREFENGDFEFRFSVPEHETFWYGAVLSFGDKVRILEPQELRDRIIKTCREIQSAYGERPKSKQLIQEASKMTDVYKTCPTFENASYLLRLIEEGDAGDLLEVYSDKNALPFFNSDNCHGDNFYYPTAGRMGEAVNFWISAYQKRWFVRFTIIDKAAAKAIGTVELFHRDADDAFNNTGVLRLDVKSSHEREDVIGSIISLITPPSFELFCCDRIITKAPIYAVERIKALQRLGFIRSEHLLTGAEDGCTYSGYWEIAK